MAVYYKFKSEKSYSVVPLDGLLISVGELKQKIFKLRRLGGTDRDLVLTNPHTNKEFLESGWFITDGTKVIVHRVLKRRKPIVTAPVCKQEELNVGHNSGDVQADQSSEKSAGDLRGIEIGKTCPFHSGYLIPPIGVYHDPIKYGLDWGGTRSDLSAPFDRKITPPPEYICPTCNVSGHFMAFCPKKGPQSDLTSLIAPITFPKVLGTLACTCVLPSEDKGVVEPDRCVPVKEVKGPLTFHVYEPNENMRRLKSYRSSAEMQSQTPPDLAPKMQPSISPDDIARERSKVLKGSKTRLLMQSDFERDFISYYETKEAWPPTWKDVRKCPQYIYGLLHLFLQKWELEKYDHVDDSEYPLARFYNIDKDAHSKFKRFLKQVRESRGYDVDCIPPAFMGSPFRPENVDMLMTDERKRHTLTEQKKIVVNKINSEAEVHGEKYELCQIEKVVNVPWHRAALLTLTVREVSSDVVKTVQAMVANGWFDDFRLKEWRFKPEDDTPGVPDDIMRVPEEAVPELVAEPEDPFS